MAHTSHYWIRAVLVLALLGFTAHVFALSAERLQPRFDEVAYLASARDYAREGGVLATISCHFEGRCRDDVRHPLFQLGLQAIADDTPRAFADAKLFTLATGLLLLAVVFACVRAAFGSAIAAAAVVCLCLMPVLAEHAASVQHDLLFTALFVACVYACAAWQERGAAWWLLVGALVGLAYLTKGNGHLLFVPILAAGLRRHGLSFFARAAPWAALVGFAAVAAFLLWRNATVFGNPFHNLNLRIAWIDGWESFWTLSRSSEWADVGLGWYLDRHSVFDLLLRIGKGLGMTLGVLVYTAGVGPAGIVARAATGLVLVALATWGLRMRYRAGQTSEVVAVIAAAASLVLVFSLSAEAGALSPRHLLPAVVLLLPYALLALRDGNFLRIVPPNAVAALRVIAVLLVAAQVAWFAVGFSKDPRSQYAVPEEWQRTSEWLSRSLRPGERFAIPYHSDYSTFDRPWPDTDPRWSYAYRTPAPMMLGQMAEHRIAKALVDTRDPDAASYADKLSGERDAQGPLEFLGWPRCFADGGRPSRFLVYCRSTPDRAPSGTAPAPPPRRNPPAPAPPAPPYTPPARRRAR